MIGQNVTSISIFANNALVDICTVDISGGFLLEVPYIIYENSWWSHLWSESLNLLCVAVLIFRFQKFPDALYKENIVYLCLFYVHSYPIQIIGSLLQLSSFISPTTAGWTCDLSSRTCVFLWEALPVGRNEIENLSIALWYNENPLQDGVDCRDW